MHLRKQQKLFKKVHGSKFATPEVNKIVIIKDDTPRSCWQYGKVSELTKSSDRQKLYHFSY